MKKSLLRFCELSTFRVTKSFLRGRVSDSSGIVFHFFFLSCSHDLYTAPWPYIYNLYNIVCTLRFVSAAAATANLDFERQNED